MLVRFPFTHTSKAARKRRYILQAKIAKRNLKIFRYKFAYRHPATGAEMASGTWLSQVIHTGEILYLFVAVAVAV